MTAYPFWKIEHGGEIPKGFDGSGIEEVKSFVAEHDVTSITFYVDVDLDSQTRNVTRKTGLNKKVLTKEELGEVTLEWVTERVKEAGEIARTL